MKIAVIGNEEYALLLIPSGILYPGKAVILGAGMVIDPAALFSGLKMLNDRGIDTTGRGSAWRTFPGRKRQGSWKGRTGSSLPPLSSGSRP